MDNFKKILEDIKNKTLGTLYLLQGEEAFLIDRLTSAFEKDALPDDQKDFNQVVLYGGECDWKRVVEEARRMPMFGDRTLVIVREANQMRTLNELVSYVENPTPSATLVIEVKGKKLDGKTKLAQQLKKKATVFESEKIKETELGSWVIKMGKELGLEINHELAEKIAAHLGSDLQKIFNELQKIKISEPGIQVLNDEVIERYVGISREYNAIEFVNALFGNKPDKLAACINYFTANPKNAASPLVVGIIYNFLSRVYAAHYAKDFNEQKKYGVWAQHKEFAGRYSLAVVHQLIDITHEYARKAVGIQYNASGYETWLRELTARIRLVLR